MANERRLDVLRAIVSDYVATGEPVGSRALVERHQLGVSPATVRNDMAALEDEGFIHQPHTSAGRVPTDRGYRLFVDRIDQIKPLSGAERRAITALLDAAVDIEDVLERSVRLLSELTRQVAVVQMPALRHTAVRHIEVLSIAPTRTLLVLIAQTGRVDQRFCELPLATEADVVDDIGRLLDRICHNKTAQEITSILALAIEQEPDRDRAQLIEILAGACLEVLGQAHSESRIVMAGMAHLARADMDFAHTITPVVEALEEQVVLLKLFSEMGADGPVRVSIGEENRHVSLMETAVVSSSYESANRTTGRVGVIGPTRMDYPTSMAAVRAVARYLSRILGA